MPAHQLRAQLRLAHAPTPTPHRSAQGGQEHAGWSSLHRWAQPSLVSPAFKVHLGF